MLGSYIYRSGIKGSDLSRRYRYESSALQTVFKSDKLVRTTREYIKIERGQEVRPGTTQC